MTTMVPGVLMVILCVLFAVAGLKFVQRLVPFAIRARHNDVAGFIYAVLGVVYANNKRTYAHRRCRKMS